MQSEGGLVFHNKWFQLPALSHSLEMIKNGLISCCFLKIIQLWHQTYVISHNWWLLILASLFPFGYTEVYNLSVGNHEGPQVHSAWVGKLTEDGSRVLVIWLSWSLMIYSALTNGVSRYATLVEGTTMSRTIPNVHRNPLMFTILHLTLANHFFVYKNYWFLFR